MNSGGWKGLIIVKILKGIKERSPLFNNNNPIEGTQITAYISKNKLSTMLIIIFKQAKVSYKIMLSYPGVNWWIRIPKGRIIPGLFL